MPNKSRCTCHETKKNITPLDKKMERFEDKIAEYRESDLKSSPIWVWFSKSNDQKNEARCGICNTIKWLHL